VFAHNLDLPLDPTLPVGRYAARTSGTKPYWSADEGIKAAVRNGVRSIEHGIYLDDEGIELMLDRGAWLVPTLVAPRAVLAIVDAGGALPPEVAEKARKVLEVHTESVRRAIGAGVKIAMGTDSGVGPHGNNLDELRLMVHCGMSPLGALHAATGSAAQLCGVDGDRGTIEVGKQADIALFAGDIRDLIPKGGQAMRDAVRQVWIDGRAVHQAA
jgi:imidazolonepropionase-like amidohydrolase